MESTGHRWIPLKRPVMCSFECFIDVRVNKLLNKQSSFQWAERPWHLCVIIVLSARGSSCCLVLMLSLMTDKCYLYIPILFIIFDSDAISATCFCRTCSGFITKVLPFPWKAGFSIIRKEMATTCSLLIHKIYVHDRNVIYTYEKSVPWCSKFDSWAGKYSKNETSFQ